MSKWTTNIDIVKGASIGQEIRKYIITLTKEMTVGEFIDEILKEKPNEWGYFDICNKKGPIFDHPYCEYGYGKLKTNPISDEFLNKKIKAVQGNGGCSRSDFTFYIGMDEEKKTADDSIKDLVLDKYRETVKILNENIELRKQIDSNIKRYLEMNIGEVITQEMIDLLWVND